LIQNVEPVEVMMAAYQGDTIKWGITRSRKRELSGEKNGAGEGKEKGEQGDLGRGGLTGTRGGLCALIGLKKQKKTMRS